MWNRFPNIRTLKTLNDLFKRIPKSADSLGDCLEQFGFFDSTPNPLKAFPQESNRVSQSLNDRREEPNNSVHSFFECIALFERLILPDNPVRNLGQNISKDISERLHGWNQLCYAISNRRKSLFYNINSRRESLNDLRQLFVDCQARIYGLASLFCRIPGFFKSLGSLVCRLFGSTNRGFYRISSIPVGIPCRQISGAPFFAIRPIAFFAFLKASLSGRIQLVVGVVLLLNQIDRNSKLCGLILRPGVEVALFAPRSNKRKGDVAVFICPLLHPVGHSVVYFFGFLGVRLCRP